MSGNIDELIKKKQKKRFLKKKMICDHYKS